MTDLPITDLAGLRGLRTAPALDATQGRRLRD